MGPMREGEAQLLGKIAVFKTGWCDFYNGDVVKGEHNYIRFHHEGHERYNFKPAPDDSYCGYTPPISDKYPPSPKDKDGWLIFVLAKKPRESGLYLVGWYEDASFSESYMPRPEYREKPPALERDAQGKKFSYIVSAPTATRISPVARRFRFDGSRMRRSPVYYLRGNGIKDSWRETLARVLLKAKAEFETSTDADPVLPRGGICGDQDQRKEIEKAAIATVRAHLAKDYECADRQNDNCGFDLLFVHRKSNDELHVEVKGTAGLQPHFFISVNEHAHAEKFLEWRLAMVTNALNKPAIEIMTYAQAKQRFDWQPFTWHATARVENC